MIKSISYILLILALSVFSNESKDQSKEKSELLVSMSSGSGSCFGPSSHKSLNIEKIDNQLWAIFTPDSRFWKVKGHTTAFGTNNPDNIWTKQLNQADIKRLDALLKKSKSFVGKNCGLTSAPQNIEINIFKYKNYSPAKFNYLSLCFENGKRAKEREIGTSGLIAQEKKLNKNLYNEFIYELFAKHYKEFHKWEANEKKEKEEINSKLQGLWIVNNSEKNIITEYQNYSWNKSKKIYNDYIADQINLKKADKCDPNQECWKIIGSRIIVLSDSINSIDTTNIINTISTFNNSNVVVKKIKNNYNLEFRLPITYWNHTIALAYKIDRISANSIVLKYGNENGAHTYFKYMTDKREKEQKKNDAIWQEELYKKIRGVWIYDYKRDQGLKTKIWKNDTTDVMYLSRSAKCVENKPCWVIINGTLSTKGDPIYTFNKTKFEAEYFEKYMKLKLSPGALKFVEKESTIDFEITPINKMIMKVKITQGKWMMKSYLPK